MTCSICHKNISKEEEEDEAAGVCVDCYFEAIDKANEETENK